MTVTAVQFGFTSPLRADAGQVSAGIRGGVATLRPLTAGEHEPLETVFAGMSPRSRALRYLTPLPRLPMGMRRALTAVDGRTHVAWVALVDGQPAGIARYVHVDRCAVDLAFEVVDAHQGRGLGSVLLDTVTTVAAASRVRRVQATVDPSNARSVRLVAAVGLRLSVRSGVLEGEAPLSLMTPPRVDRPAVVRIALASRSAVVEERTG